MILVLGRVMQHSVANVLPMVMSLLLAATADAQQWSPPIDTGVIVRLTTQGGSPYNMRGSYHGVIRDSLRLVVPRGDSLGIPTSRLLWIEALRPARRRRALTWGSIGALAGGAIGAGIARLIEVDMGPGGAVGAGAGALVGVTAATVFAPHEWIRHVKPR